MAFPPDRGERIEEIDFDWVKKAEKVWKSSQWAKVFHKMGRETNETLTGSEIALLEVLLFFF